jgi:DNA-directed RNA polymerase specialized sigma24 family protein
LDDALGFPFLPFRERVQGPRTFMPRPPDETPQSFPATQWSLVDRARQTDEGARHEALADFLRRYLPALRTHLISERRMDGERADDLLQGFVADKIIEQGLLDHAQEGRGKFRSFLLVTLNNYVISQHRSESAAKRLPISGIADLGDVAQQIAGGHDPAQSFNVAWAREMIAEAMRRMQAECTQSSRPDLWTIFQGRVVRPAFEGEEPVGYERLVSDLGLAAPLEACRLLTTAKRMFSRNLRAVASEYAGTQGDTDGEIDDLRQILTAAKPPSSRPVAGM